MFRKEAGREAFRGQMRLQRIYVIKGPKTQEKVQKRKVLEHKIFFIKYLFLLLFL